MKKSESSEEHARLPHALKPSIIGIISAFVMAGIALGATYFLG